MVLGPERLSTGAGGTGKCKQEKYIINSYFFPSEISQVGNGYSVSVYVSGILVRENSVFAQR